MGDGQDGQDGASGNIIARAKGVSLLGTHMSPLIFSC